MADITPESLARLRELADKATPGPWYGDVTPPGPSGSVARNEAIVTADKVHIARRGLQKSIQWWRDASFIADANPATVLALLDEVERLRRRCDIRDRTAAHWSEAARREVPTDELERARNNFVECKIRQEEAPRGSIMRRVCDAAVDLVAMLDKRDDTMKARVVELSLEVERLRAENEKLRADLAAANDLVARLRAKCEERKACIPAVVQVGDRGDEDDSIPIFGCPGCRLREGSGHKPGCTWQRAMEDV